MLRYLDRRRIARQGPAGPGRWFSGRRADRTAPIDAELRRRQGGYGRGGRQRIETDHVDILSGIWHGTTLGSPIALQVDQQRLQARADGRSRPPAPGPRRSDRRDQVSRLDPRHPRTGQRPGNGRPRRRGGAGQAIAAASSASRRSATWSSWAASRLEPHPGTLDEHRAPARRQRAVLAQSPARRAESQER